MLLVKITKFYERVGFIKDTEDDVLNGNLIVLKTSKISLK